MHKKDIQVGETYALGDGAVRVIDPRLRLWKHDNRFGMDSLTMVQGKSSTPRTTMPTIGLLALRKTPSFTTRESTEETMAALDAIQGVEIPEDDKKAQAAALNLQKALKKVPGIRLTTVDYREIQRTLVQEAEHRDRVHREMEVMQADLAANAAADKELWEPLKARLQEAGVDYEVSRQHGADRDAASEVRISVADLARLLPSQQPEPSLGDKIKAAMDEDARGLGQEIRDQHQRAGTLILGGRSGRITELVSLGPHEGDDYIAETVQRRDGVDRPVWRVVVGGKLSGYATEHRDYALLIYLAAKYEPGDGALGARYASRVLCVPDDWD